MVLCMIVGCGSKSGRDKGLYFARVPSVVTNQGEEAQELSKERRSRWVSAISRDDLTEEILENDRVCEKGAPEKYGQQLAKCSNTVKHLAKSVAALQL